MLCVDIGNLIRLSATFYELLNSNQSIDPTAVILTVVQPDTSELTFNYPGAVLRDSVGDYHYDFQPTQTGIHVYRYVGTGVAPAAGDNVFNVNYSAAYPP